MSALPPKADNLALASNCVIPNKFAEAMPVQGLDALVKKTFSAGISSDFISKYADRNSVATNVWGYANNRSLDQKIQIPRSCVFVFGHCNSLEHGSNRLAQPAWV